MCGKKFFYFLSQLSHPTAIVFIGIPVLELPDYPIAARRARYVTRL
jgi:hypothetical protein